MRQPHPIRIILTLLLLCLSFATIKAEDDERIFGDAKINGLPVKFIFDTGCSVPFSIFSIKMGELGLKDTPPDRPPPPGRLALGKTELCNLDFGTTNFRIPLDVIETPAAIRWAEVGFIGWPAVSNNVISIDATADSANLLSGIPPQAKTWQKYDIRTDTDILAFAVPAANGGQMAVQVDTGSVLGVSLNPKLWHEWKAAHPNQPLSIDATFMPSAGLVVKEMAWAQKISLGSLEITDVAVMEANQGQIRSCPHFGASLGLAAMKRLNIVVDGIHGTMYLQPKTTPPRPIKHNRIGAVFTPLSLGGGDLLAHVVDAGPAYEAGIRNGDVLLKIDNLDATKWLTDPNVLPLSRFWEGPAGSKISLTLKRGETNYATIVVLRNILPPDPPKNAN